MFKIIQKSKYFVAFSAILMTLSILSLIFWGLKLGIDFTGGSLIELEFNNTERPTNDQLTQKLSELNLASLSIQPIGEKGILIRTESLTEDQHQEILKKIDELVPGKNIGSEELKSMFGLEGEGLESAQIEFNDPNNTLNLNNTRNFSELRFDSIGPLIGKELQQKTLYAIVIVLIAIILYIAFVFRKVSKPIESWKYGVSATIALSHDVLITVGVFSVLGHYFGVQADSLFVTALLTLLGFSVHDTIVTFDRIRENLHRRQDVTFENLINLSINETIIRSINTSMTTLIVLVCIFIFGGETIKYFSLALIVGIFIGTYSSIFIASPLLLFFYKLKKYN